MSDTVTKWHEMQTPSENFTTTTTPIGVDFTREAYTILSMYNPEAVRIANDILDKVEGTNAE